MSLVACPLTLGQTSRREQMCGVEDAVRCDSEPWLWNHCSRTVTKNRENRHLGRKITGWLAAAGPAYILSSRRRRWLFFDLWRSLLRGPIQMHTAPGSYIVIHPCRRALSFPRICQTSRRHRRTWITQPRKSRHAAEKSCRPGARQHSTFSIITMTRRALSLVYLTTADVREQAMPILVCRKLDGQFWLTDSSAFSEELALQHRIMPCQEMSPELYYFMRDIFVSFSSKAVLNEAGRHHMAMTFWVSAVVARQVYQHDPCCCSNQQLD